MCSTFVLHWHLICVLTVLLTTLLLLFMQLQLEVWHVGSFRFKGVPEPMHVMHLGNSLVNGRVFPAHTPSKKAERVAPSLGLQCIIGVPAF